MMSRRPFSISDVSVFAAGRLPFLPYRAPPSAQVFVQFFGSRVPPTTSIQKIEFRLPVKAE